MEPYFCPLPSFLLVGCPCNRGGWHENLVPCWARQSPYGRGSAPCWEAVRGLDQAPWTGLTLATGFRTYVPPGLTLPTDTSAVVTFTVLIRSHQDFPFRLIPETRPYVQNLTIVTVEGLARPRGRNVCSSQDDKIYYAHTYTDLGMSERDG